MDLRKALAYIVRAQSLDDVQELLALYLEDPSQVVRLTLPEEALEEALPSEVERLLYEGFSVMIEKDGELLPIEETFDDGIGIQAPVAWFIDACGGARRLAKEVWKALRAGRPSLAPRPPRWISSDSRVWWDALDEAEKEEEAWAEEWTPDPIEWIEPSDLGLPAHDWNPYREPVGVLEAGLEALDPRLPSDSRWVRRLREEKAWEEELFLKEQRRLAKRQARMRKSQTS